MATEAPQEGQAAEVPRNSSEFEKLTASGIWKGENESDVEVMENYDENPLSDAGAWTEDEALVLYRHKLIKLRELYYGQMVHLKHTVRERRRQFLMEWYGEGGETKLASSPSHSRSPDAMAYRQYRKRTPEEAVLARRRKARKIAASMELISHKEGRDSHKEHYHYLLKLQTQLGYVGYTPCSTSGCEGKSLPLTDRCSLHVCDDHNQLLYTRCSYVYPSGQSCSKPIPRYLNLPLCGGHCDHVELQGDVMVPVTSGPTTSAAAGRTHTSTDGGNTQSDQS